MRPTSDDTLPCAVFGHNYIKSKRQSGHSTQLSCNQCGISITTDANGNFEEASIANKAIQNTLRRLYHLKIKTTRQDLSS